MPRNNEQYDFMIFKNSWATGSSKMTLSLETQSMSFPACYWQGNKPILRSKRQSLTTDFWYIYMCSAVDQNNSSTVASLCVWNMLPVPLGLVDNYVHLLKTDSVDLRLPSDFFGSLGNQWQQILLLIYLLVSTKSENKPVCLLLAFRWQCVSGDF